MSSSKRSRAGLAAVVVGSLLSALMASVVGSSVARATPSFVTRTTSDGLGANAVKDIVVSGGNLYLATFSIGAGGRRVGCRSRPMAVRPSPTRRPPTVWRVTG